MKAYRDSEELPQDSYRILGGGHCRAAPWAPGLPDLRRRPQRQHRLLLSQLVRVVRPFDLPDVGIHQPPGHGCQLPRSHLLLRDRLQHPRAPALRGPDRHLRPGDGRRLERLLIYEWIEEENHYGIISYGPKVDPTVTGKNIEGGFTRAGTPTPVSPDFDNLKKQWATIGRPASSFADYDSKKVLHPRLPEVHSWWLDG